MYCYFNTFLIVNVKNQDPMGRQSQVTDLIDVLWISVHKSFKMSTREHNVAIIGTVFPLQFHAHLYPICLPSASYSDTNAG